MPRSCIFSLIELQRASLSYDRAYSDECKAMKKRPKDGGGYDSQRSDPEDSNDLNMLYNEVVTFFYLKLLRYSVNMRPNIIICNIMIFFRPNNDRSCIRL